LVQPGQDHDHDRTKKGPKMSDDEQVIGRRSGAFYDVYGKDQDYRETRQQYGDRLAEDAARERDCD
jgi:hypothetical protein